MSSGDEQEHRTSDWNRVPRGAVLFLHVLRVPFNSQLGNQIVFKTTDCVGWFFWPGTAGGKRKNGSVKSSDCSDAWQKVAQWRGRHCGPAESRPTSFWNFLGAHTLWVWAGFPAGCFRIMCLETRNGVGRQWKLAGSQFEVKNDWSLQF